MSTNLAQTIPALVQLMVNAAPSDVEVFDGEPIDPQQRKFVCVGWDESGQATVVMSRAPIDAGGSTMREQVDVTCLLSCWSGSEGQLTVRNEALTALNAFDNALAADRSLGGLVQMAFIREVTCVVEDRNPQGWLAQVVFTVRYVAL